MGKCRFILVKVVLVLDNIAIFVESIERLLEKTKVTYQIVRGKNIIIIKSVIPYLNSCSLVISTRTKKKKKTLREMKWIFFLLDELF